MSEREAFEAWWNEAWRKDSIPPPAFTRVAWAAWQARAAAPTAPAPDALHDNKTDVTEPAEWVLKAKTRSGTWIEHDPAGPFYPDCEYRWFTKGEAA